MDLRKKSALGPSSGLRTPLRVKAKAELIVLRKCVQPNRKAKLRATQVWKTVGAINRPIHYYKTIIECCVGNYG